VDLGFPITKVNSATALQSLRWPAVELAFLLDWLISAVDLPMTLIASTMDCLSE
jgi:hypothetical protein